MQILFLSVFCMFFVFPSVVFMDAPEAWQMTFQNPASPIAQGIQDLHHDIFFYGFCGYFCSMDAWSNSMAF